MLSLHSLLNTVHLSLSEEARNTERHHSWNSDLKLRHSQIAFVSAGAPKAEDLTQIPQGSPNERTEKLRGTSKDIGETPAEISGKKPAKSSPIIVPESTMSNMNLSDVHAWHSNKADRELTGVETMKEDRPPEDVTGSDLFFTDLNGFDKPMCTRFALPSVKRSPSPTASDSSEEIILFAGRKTSHGQPQRDCDSMKFPSIQPRPSGRAKAIHRSPPMVIEDSPRINLDGNGSVPASSPQRVPTAAPTLDTLAFGKDQIQRGSHKRRQGKRRIRSSKVDDDTTVLADYIANISDSAGQDELARGFTFNQRDLGGFDNDWQNEEEVSALDPHVDITISDDEWDSDDLQDFNEMSTSSGFIDVVERILLKRKRPSGVHYLVTTEGCITDDARWLPIEVLNSAGADEKIRIFEQERAELECRPGSSEESEDSLTIDEQIAMDLEGDLDDLMDEQDLEERRKDRMTDEKIAQLLSKQEELGLGSNDLLLFDGEDLVGNAMRELPLDESLGHQPLMQRRPKQKKRHQAPFPSATLFADVLDQDPYDGFDIMDQERPSLRRRTKGRRGTLALELSDSELEQSFTLAWENDRAKKKLRKQEREELRAQGLLGKKDKVDMKAKYAEGMSMDAIKHEIREFLISSMQRYSRMGFQGCPVD